MTALLLWLILLLISWPIALAFLFVLPVLWLLSLPFRLLFGAVEGLVRAVVALFLLPARLLRGRSALARS